MHELDIVTHLVSDSGRIRTDTEQDLNLPPLPLGYGAIGPLTSAFMHTARGQLRTDLPRVAENTLLSSQSTAASFGPSHGTSRRVYDFSRVSREMQLHVVSVFPRVLLSSCSQLYRTPSDRVKHCLCS